MPARAGYSIKPKLQNGGDDKKDELKQKLEKLKSEIKDTKVYKGVSAFTKKISDLVTFKDKKKVGGSVNVNIRGYGGKAPGMYHGVKGE